MTDKPNIFREDGEIPDELAQFLPENAVFDRALGRYIPFSKADLIANRDGQFTRDQFLYWHKDINSRYASGVGLFTFVMGSLFWMFSQAITCVAPLIIIVMFIIFPLTFLYYYTAIHAIHHPQIKVASGYLLKENAFLNRIGIGYESFSVINKEAWDTFIEGEMYDVYYLAESRLVIAAAPLPGSARDKRKKKKAN